MSKNDTGVYLAVDLGASSGRVMAGNWDGQRLILDEVHRFQTPSVKVGAYLHWDILALYSNIVEGLRRAARQFGSRIVSVGVDTWGVDYGLLDKSGELLSNPICYRDKRTDGMADQLCAALGKEEIYRETGIQFMFFNTINQLAAERRDQRVAFRNASRMLFLPDLLNYWLSGVKATERSIASTSQMLNPQTGDWSEPILKELGLEKSFLGEVVDSSVNLGPIRDALQQELDCQAFDVVTTAGHDTASAFMARAEADPDYAILSSGTWSLMGLELESANCSVAAMEAGFTNEIGYGKAIRFQMNICGMWLLEECLRHWKKQGETFGYAEIAQLAKDSTPMASLFNPDDPQFATAGNMPGRIARYCEASGQPIPNTVGEIARSIFDSLAMKYRYAFKKLESFAPRPLKGIQILGGGSRNQLLNQLTADALGVPVVAGPNEATAIGNIIAQQIASGALADMEEARTMISKSFDIERFEPQQSEIFEQASERFSRLVETPCST